MRKRSTSSRGSMTSNTSQAASGPAGGRVRDDLAIRFVNTAAWRLRASSEERLPDAGALLAWLRANGIAEPKSLTVVAQAWRDDPERGRSVYEAAIALRESIYGILAARMMNRAPPAAALDLLNRLLRRAADGAEVAWRSGELIWRVRPQGDDLSLLKPILVSAADLATGPRGGRVKQCQDDRGCGWLFVDESRAQNRRWCSMGDCGNRAKAQRHYRRARSEERR
jgi:predicted RNA-binding Zn ribbon-like protein